MVIRNAVIFLAVVAALGGVAWFVLQNRPVTAPEGEAAPPATVPGEDQEYTESTDLYSITITYPTAPTPAIQAGVDALVEEEIERFKTESVGLIDDLEADRIRTQGRLYELIIEYKPYQYGTFVSYEFDIYLDTGGAHPNAFFRTATFDKNGNEFMLEDLFIENSPYLTRLAEASYTRVLEELRRRAGGEVTPDMEDIVRVGTAPSPETLQFFYLNDGVLHLLFPPYQVAAYAAGSFDIAIPLTELADILRPEIR